MTQRTDMISAANAPFDPSAPHKKLAAFAGTWAGATQTWLDPSAPPIESQINATIEALLGGRFVRIAYASTVNGKPHAGEMTLAFHVDANAHEVSWIDSFHTGTSIMLSTGAAREDGAVTVLGSYGAGEERWGWRTSIRQSSPDELTLEATNLTPTGEESPAILTRLRRC